MASGIIPIIKQAALDAVKTSDPVAIVYGTVMSISPLQIRVNANLILDESSGILKLTRQVTDYETEMTVMWETENTGGGSGESSFESHKHTISGKKKVTIHNGLKAQDTVVMLKAQGGQSYIILDKVG